MVSANLRSHEQQPIDGLKTENPFNFACSSSARCHTMPAMKEARRQHTSLPQQFMQRLLVIVVVAFAMVSAAAHAQQVATQSPAAVRRAVEEFVRVQTSALGNRATFTVGAVDSRLALAACGALEVFVPVGGKLWGNSSVGVRCGAPTPWTLYVSVTVRVSGSYVAAARAITAGHTLVPADLTIVQGDLTQLPPTVVTDLSQAVGNVVNAPLAPAQPVRADTLRVLPAVVQGQSVKLVSQGPGFRVSSDGKALVNAAAGQVAQARTASGQTVSGIARPDGSIEVNY
jgi:flagellar basal body P-ring formation protein FlgA